MPPFFPTRARIYILLFILLACARAYSADWLVDPNGDSAADDLFISLEDAIASDKVSGGDTLTLRPGNYVHETELVLNKALTMGDGTGEVILEHANQPRKVSKTAKKYSLVRP